MQIIAEKRKRVVRDKQTKIEYRGLCSTCEKAPTCTFPRDPRRSVLQCDEFEGYATAPKRVISGGPLPKTRLKLSPEEEELGKYRGLCKNCEKRKTCTYPKPEWGVWRCEEYE